MTKCLAHTYTLYFSLFCAQTLTKNKLHTRVRTLFRFSKKYIANKFVQSFFILKDTISRFEKQT